MSVRYIILRDVLGSRILKYISEFYDKKYGERFARIKIQGKGDVASREVLVITPNKLEKLIRRIEKHIEENKSKTFNPELWSEVLEAVKSLRDSDQWQERE